MNTTELRSALTGKLGPLPAWQWGVGLGAAVLIVRAVRQRTSSAPAAAAGDPSAPEGNPADVVDAGPSGAPSGGAGGFMGFTPTAGFYSGGSANGGTSPAIPDAPQDPYLPTPRSYVDNEAWSRAAIDAVTARGSVTPLDAVETMQRALAGQALTLQQAAILSTAIRLVGNPPDPLPPVQRPPDPTPTPDPPPPPVRPALKQGDTGDAVKVMQRAVGETPVDGRYGPHTAATVKRWAKTHGVTTNGKTFGPELWAFVPATAT